MRHHKLLSMHIQHCMLSDIVTTHHFTNIPLSRCKTKDSKYIWGKSTRKKMYVNIVFCSLVIDCFIFKLSNKLQHWRLNRNNKYPFFIEYFLWEVCGEGPSSFPLRDECVCISMQQLCNVLCTVSILNVWL